jgi:transposase
VCAAYCGGPDHFRHLVACHRPRPPAEAYLRLRSLPGEQAQVDWGHFGHLVIGRARRPLMAFVMLLSWSRGRRLFAAAEVRAAGWGGLAAVSEITGLARLAENRTTRVVPTRKTHVLPTGDSRKP